MIAKKSSCDYNHFMKNSLQTPVLKLDGYWPYQVTVLADRIARRTSSIVKSHRLNLSQWRVLAAIAEEPGRTSVDVVTVTPMDKGIVSRATKALIEMNLVRKEASQQDGRASHLFLTHDGESTYAEVMPKIIDGLADARTLLSASEAKDLTSMLTHLKDALPDLR